MAGSAITIHLTYPPLPENVFEATLTFTQIPGVPPGKGPEGWQIPLHFKPGPAAGRVIDAIPLNLSSPEHQGITLVLESLAQTPGMDALRVRLEMNDPDLGMEVNWESGFRLEKTNGSQVLLEASSIFDPDGSASALLKVPLLEPGEHYILKLQGPIQVVKSSSADEKNSHFTLDPSAGPQSGQTWVLDETDEKNSRFTLDLGANPQVGQSWVLDQTLVAGGKVIHLSGAHLLSGDRCSASSRPDSNLTSLVFDIDPQPGVTGLMIGPLHPTPMVDRIYQGKCVVYKGTPNGSIEFKIFNVTYPVDGTWEIPWQVPGG